MPKRSMIQALLLLVLGMSTTGVAGPLPSDLKKLHLAYIDPPIKAPEFRLTDLNRRKLSLSGLRGRGVLLYFWASW